MAIFLGGSFSPNGVVPPQGPLRLNPWVPHTIRGKTTGAQGSRVGVVPSLSFRVSSSVFIGGLQMQPTNNKRFYSPQLSAQASVSIRRLAWSTGRPMTKAIETLVMALPAIVDPSKICLSCKDKSACKTCIFCRHFTAEEKAALLAAL